MITEVIIKRTSRDGRDSQLFRAYSPDPAGRIGKRDEPLGVSASTTGNPRYAVISCAAKAFKRYNDPAGDVDEIETRCKVTTISEALDIYRVTLEAK